MRLNFWEREELKERQRREVALHGATIREVDRSLEWRIKMRDREGNHVSYEPSC